MTEKEKAEAYNKAIERTKKLYGNRITKEIFPELKEDDDERIRKNLIQWVNEFPGIIWRGHYKNDIIAWLEKQGDKDKLIQELGEYKIKYIQEVLEKHITSMSNKDDERLRKNTISFLKDFAELGYENAIECIDWLEKQGEQKPQGKSALEATKEENVDNANKVEPKFKVGDWIITPENKVLQITSIEGTSYRFNNESHYWEFCYCDEQCHLWTIEDAKDGDVLSFYSEYKGNKMVQIGIIEKYVGKHGGCSDTFKIYIGVNWDNNLKMDKYMGCSNIHPATKEQCDLLFQKIKEASYEWDAEKKELKKKEK